MGSQSPGSGRNVAGMLPIVGEQWPADLPSHWMVYFAVDGCDAAAANVAELGGAVTVPPTDIPVGHLSVLNDPLGVVFSIIRMNQFDPGP
jgi:predicted enzyme related to lactoylglutathione lyase